MAQILTPGFLKWDGVKYILDPTVDDSSRPTIINNGTGVLADIVSDEAGVPAGVIVFTGTSNITLTGIKDGVESRELKVFNTDPAATLTITHLDNTSVAANQIICPGGTDFVLSYQEGILLVYSSVEVKWRVLELVDQAGGGAGTPGGDNTQLQRNNNGSFGGIVNWTADAQNVVHVDAHVMQQGPSLEFDGANTITRLYWSWVSDGFKVGDLISIRGEWYDNGNILQAPLDIINAKITSVTDTEITIDTTISPAGYALSNDVFIEGGGCLSGGDAADVLPDAGIIRLTPPADQYKDRQAITTRDKYGTTIPIISINSYGDVMIGGTFNESNTANGVTDRRADIIALWGYYTIDFTDTRVWRDDKGGFFEYQTEFRGHVTTSDATPTQLINKSTSSAYAFIELHVTATKVFPTDQGATWRFFGSKASTTFDWRTADYHVSTAGASTWGCTVTNQATVTVTGQAGVPINWKVYGRFICG